MDDDALCTAVVEAETEGERRDLIVKKVAEAAAGPEAAEHARNVTFLSAVLAHQDGRGAMRGPQGRHDRRGVAGHHARTSSQRED